MPMHLLPFSSFPFALVLAMELAAIASVPLVMLPWVKGTMFLPLLIFTLSAPAALVCHYRCARRAAPSPPSATLYVCLTTTLPVGLWGWDNGVGPPSGRLCLVGSAFQL